MPTAYNGCGTRPFSLRSYNAADRYPRWSLHGLDLKRALITDSILYNDKEPQRFEISACASYSAAELREFSAAGRFDFENKHVANDPEIAIICVNDALVCGASGAILDSNGDLVLESLFPFRRSRPFEHLSGMVDFKNCTGFHELDEEVCLLFGGGGANNFWHFHIDMLPSVQVFQDWGFDGFKFALCPAARWQVEALTRLGLDQSQILFLDNAFYKVKRCFLTSTLFNPIVSIPNQTTRTLLGRLAETIDTHRSVGLYSDAVLTYISRQDSTARLMINEQNLIDRLLDIGFDILTMSDLEYSDQLRAAKSSSVIVGAHGAGLTSILAARPDTLIVEIFPFGVLDAPHYYLLANALGSFYEMHVSSVKANISAHHHWTLDIDAFIFRLACLLDKYHVCSRSIILERVHRTVGHDVVSHVEQSFGKEFDLSSSVYCYGFFAQEDWGFWLVKRLGAICFLRELPKRFSLTLNADVFGPSASRGIQIEIGNLSYEIGQGDMTFVVENPDACRTLFFRADGATSPAVHYDDPSGEGRTVSLALKSLSIDELAE